MASPYPSPLTPQQRHYATRTYLIFTIYLTTMALITSSIVLFVILGRTEPLHGGSKLIFWVNWAAMPCFVASARIAWNRRRFAMEGLEKEDDEEAVEGKKLLGDRVESGLEA